ncbi:MAG: hydantoinase/oxoprolinase family protein, partial [Oscillospiraceae bacterium]
DVVERVIPNPTQSDIAELRKEAKDAAINSGAEPDSVEVHIEIDSQTGKVTAIATGSTEVKTTDLLKECSEEEALELAVADFGAKVLDVKMAQKTEKFYVFSGDFANKNALRIVDKKGFIRVQCSDGEVIKCKIIEYKEVVEQMWQDLAVFKTDTVLRPDFFLCVGPRVCDYSAIDMQQLEMLMNLDTGDREADEEILVVGTVNDIH